MRGNNTAEFRRQETGDRIRECGKWGSGEVGDLPEISLSS
jgi:hypothetical protein